MVDSETYLTVGVVSDRLGGRTYVLMSLIAQIKQIMHKFGVSKSLTSLGRVKSIQNGKFLPY